MNKPLIAATLALATFAGTVYAQQSTTGQNQSNPRANQDSGPVGTTNPGAPMTRPAMPNSNRDNMSSSTAPAPAASNNNAAVMTQRPARADRN